MTLGEAVKALRLKKKMRQGQLAAAVRRRGGDLSQAQLSAIENNDVKRPGCLPELAAELGTTPDKLLAGDTSETEQRSFLPESEALMPRRARAGTPAPQATSIPTRGEVAAGQWLDLDAEQDYREFKQHPIAPNPSYPLEAQYGLIVKGTSINRVAAEGTVLHCLDLALTGLEPVNDDIVIVERRRQQEGQREVTAKRIRREGDTVILAPDSTEPKWKPIRFKTTKPPEDVAVSVVAVVIGFYTPLRAR